MRLLLLIQERNGYTRTLTWTSNRLTSVTDSYSRSLAFAYDTSNTSEVIFPLTSVTCPTAASSSTSTTAP